MTNAELIVAALSFLYEDVERKSLAKDVIIKSFNPDTGEIEFSKTFAQTPLPAKYFNKVKETL